MKPHAPEKRIRDALDACADCDTCRFLMDESCPVFPKLYGLYDREREEGRPVLAKDLRELADRCTLCGLCPCPNIREDLIQGKTAVVRKRGMPLSIRLLADVQRFGRWGTRMSGLYNRLLSLPPFAGLAKRIAGIHPDRSLPQMPAQSFFAWAQNQGLDRTIELKSSGDLKSSEKPKAAYFAGCTAGYLFPEVAKAAVEVMLRNNITVHVPPQQCCGMPTLLEGDDTTSLDRAAFNLDNLLKMVESGFDIVCSCPTCGFLFTVLLSEKAAYSRDYQKSIGAGPDEIRVPGTSPAFSKELSKGAEFISLRKSLYRNILKDDGFFSSLNPLERMELSTHVSDMGFYLDRLHGKGLLNTDLGPIEGRYAYFAPCHQREQGIESPYPNLLGLIPGMSVQKVGGSLDCCGMGGSLGLKKGFHSESLQLGERIAQKIRGANPEAIITDCLSCRLQFNHLLPLPVYHPLELLLHSYNTFF